MDDNSLLAILGLKLSCLSRIVRLAHRISIFLRLCFRFSLLLCLIHFYIRYKHTFHRFEIILSRLIHCSIYMYPSHVSYSTYTCLHMYLCFYRNAFRSHFSVHYKRIHHIFSHLSIYNFLRH